MQALSFLSEIPQAQSVSNSAVSNLKPQDVDATSGYHHSTSQVAKEQIPSFSSSVESPRLKVFRGISKASESSLKSSQDKALQWDLKSSGSTTYNQGEQILMNQDEISAIQFDTERVSLDNNFEKLGENKIKTKLKIMSQTIVILNNTICNLRKLYHASRDLTQSRNEQISIFKKELNESHRELENKNEEMKNYMPVETAKKIAFSAMKKGLALEIIRKVVFSIVDEKSKKRYFLNKLLKFKRFIPEYERDQNFCSLRKEQLFLLQENERLLSQVNSFKNINYDDMDLSGDSSSRETADLSNNPRVVKGVKSDTRLLCTCISSVLKKKLMNAFLRLMIMGTSEFEQELMEKKEERRELKIEFPVKVLSKIIWARNMISKFHGFYAFIRSSYFDEKKIVEKMQNAERFISSPPQEVLQPSEVCKPSIHITHLNDKYKNKYEMKLFANGNYLNNDFPKIFIPDYYTNLPSLKAARSGAMYIPFNNSNEINLLLKSSTGEFPNRDLSEFQLNDLCINSSTRNISNPQAEESMKRELNQQLLKRSNQNEINSNQEKLMETLAKFPVGSGATYS